MTNYSTSMFIGSTTRGIPMPVFYDTHTPIFNGRPPCVVITGRPGSGKTFLGLTLTAMCAILGKTTIVMDPKGDFLAMNEITKDIGKIDFWNLNSPSERGILDPFSMVSDKGEQLGLVLTVIEMFLGVLTPAEKTILAPIVKDVQNEPVPSLYAVMEMLRESPKAEGRDLGNRLDLIHRVKFAELCFTANPRPGRRTFNSGLTVISMIGIMGMIALGEENSAQMNNQQRMGTTIFFLITDFIRRVMADSTRDALKTLVVDEAWAVLSSQAGKECIKSLTLLGRSKNFATVLITQNDSHLDGLDIENTISTRFAFNTSPKDADKIIRNMRLPEGGFADYLTQLGTGECMMMDWRGRYSTVQISDHKKSWKDAFETNPLEKMRAQRKRDAASAAKRKTAN